MDKSKEIFKCSDPKQVLQNCKKLLNNENVYLSSRRDKKYMILNPNTKQYVHFGQMGAEDLTKHKDKKRRDLFKKRNVRWKNSEIYTPAWLAYHILW